MRNRVAILTALLLMTIASCVVSGERKISDTPDVEDNGASHVTEKNAAAKISPAQAVGDESPPYLGCWTSTNGNAMRVKADTIQTMNSYKPLKFRAVLGDEFAAQRGLYLIELLESDQSNELKQFLTFKMVSKDEMNEKAYNSYDAFIADQETSQYAPWVNDSCSTVQKLLK